MVTEKSVDDKLAVFRQQIDAIDEKLMSLINERAAISKKIGKLKNSQNLAVHQPAREEFVINHVKSLSKNISPSNAQSIWKEIMAACRQIQGESNKVAYFGPIGTFTQQAAMIFFPNSNTEFIPFDQKQEIFQQVEGNYVEFGILPVENSLQGSVSETLDLLIERNLRIYGEIELRIVHNLIGQPNTELPQIKTVYSHPQALSQASIWLKKNIPQAELIEMSSTSKAVQKIVNLHDPTVVAIGTDLAADYYKLPILVKGIEDNTANYTRFVIISKKSPPSTGKDKTSIVFVVKHVPGALYSVLRIFAENKINLAKIESRPRKLGKDSLWEYIFILDFDEHIDNVKDIIEKVREQTIWLKVLGSYPRFPKTLD